jgi:hypothetical protein
MTQDGGRLIRNAAMSIAIDTFDLKIVIVTTFEHNAHAIK